MLTLDEIKNVSFRKAKFNGYMPEDVDAFIDEVIETVENQNREKADILRKLDILAKKVEQYRADEETVRNALLSTQRISDSTIKEANQKADEIIRNAQKLADKKLSDVRQSIESEKKKYVSIEAETAQLRKEIVLLYKKHLKLVDEMPTDATVAQKQAELDKKYPYVEEKPSMPDSDDDTKVAPERKKNAHVKEHKDDEEVKSSGKFDSLKFGDNYDVKED